MHIARFLTGGNPAWGLADPEAGLVRPFADPPPMREALGDPAVLAALRERAGRGVPLEEAELLAPVPDPPQFIGIGLNYREHARESGMAEPASPVSFPFFNSAIIAPGQPIVLPPFTDQVDWEVELGVVIGRPARDVSPGQALRHIAGYVIVNDVSARDIQMGEGQWSRGKSFDTFKPMGPWMATADELGTADDLAVKLWVNGDLKQSSTTADLIFNVPALVSHLSQSLTLGTGAVISTGTPSGVGFARTPPEYLRPGDEVAMEIEGIGRMSNPVTIG